MSRLETLPAACAASVSIFGAVMCEAADVALKLFGVPLPVVLAALTGAFGARVFLPEERFWKAIITTVMWTFGACFLSQLGLWLATNWLEKPPPDGVLAGVALATAFLGQRFAPIIWAEGGDALKRKLNSLYKGGE